MAKPRVQWLTNFTESKIAKATPGTARARVGDVVELDFNPFGLETRISGTGAPDRAFTRPFTFQTRFESAGDYTWTVTNADGSTDAQIVIVD